MPGRVDYLPQRWPLGWAKASGETEGLLIFIAGAVTGELLGSHILGLHTDIM